MKEKKQILHSTNVVLWTDSLIDCLDSTNWRLQTHDKQFA